MISVSLLSAYLYCKRKLFLEQVLGIHEGPKKAPLIGRIRHRIYEEINNTEQDIVTSITEKHTSSDILQLYRTSYARIIRVVLGHYKYAIKMVNLLSSELFKEIWPTMLREAELRAKNVYDFIKKSKIFGKELWQELTPKIKSELKLASKNLGLVGKIDLLELYEKKIVPVELKTGRSPTNGIWPGHKIQITAYALLLEDKYQKRVDEGTVIYLDQNIKRTVAINPFLKEETLMLKKEVEQLLRSTNIPFFTENRNKCEKCGLKQTCYDENLLQLRLQELNKTFK